MLRIAIFVILMFVVAQSCDMSAFVQAYRDYILAGALTFMLKPWLTEQFE